MGKNSVEVIVVNNMKLLNEKHIEEKLAHANLPVPTRKYTAEYRKHRCELIDNHQKQQIRNFLYKDLAIKIIMDCGKPELCKFKRKLGFKLRDVIKIPSNKQ